MISPARPAASTPTADELRSLLRTVCDPELPTLTIEDLGILRNVTVEDSRVTVTITPTYSGCPALQEIADDIRSVCATVGLDARVEVTLSPAWTTDWITERGLQALREEGIAPPGPRPRGPVALGLPAMRPTLSCPRCGSEDTEELSRFGATSCRSLQRCRSCLEPFDHFKAH